MKALRHAFYLALMAGFVCAQNDIKPEIRGSVMEPSFNIGVVGAQITLFEFAPNAENTVVRTQVDTTSTGAHGEFRFPLQHFGNYYLEVKKAGYSAPFSGPSANGTGTVATVDGSHSSYDLRFSLSRWGEITGRVTDEEGASVPGLRVLVQSMELPLPNTLGPGAVTDQEGRFTVTQLPPGRYVVLLSPTADDSETVTTQFSEDDLKIVDHDFDPAASAPLAVSPGASSNVGTITARKISYYRAHVSVTGADCQPKEDWIFSTIPKGVPTNLPYDPIPCGKEFLVRKLKPGSYWFTLRDWGTSNKWSVADVEISRENVEVSLAVTSTATVNGRITAAEGSTLPMFQGVWVMMRARMGPLIAWASMVASPNSEGKFVLKNLPWIPHDVTVQGLYGKYYVKEIRYDGAVMADGLVRLTQGTSAQNLEIVLDDQPATITGTVRDGDKPVSKPFVLVVKWPFMEGDPLLNSEHLAGDDQGRFQVSGLAPGEYRVIALTRNIVNTQISDQLLGRAEKVTLERGSVKGISLKRIDPSR